MGSEYKVLHTGVRGVIGVLRICTGVLLLRTPTPEFRS